MALNFLKWNDNKTEVIMFGGSSTQVGGSLGLLLKISC